MWLYGMWLNHMWLNHMWAAVLAYSVRAWRRERAGQAWTESESAEGRQPTGV